MLDNSVSKSNYLNSDKVRKHDLIFFLFLCCISVDINLNLPYKDFWVKDLCYFEEKKSM